MQIGVLALAATYLSRMAVGVTLVVYWFLFIIILTVYVDLRQLIRELLFWWFVQSL